MKKHIQIILICFLALQIQNAQDFKLGKVTVEELEQTQHPKDAEAEAAFLFNRLIYNMNSGFKTYTSKIKIYNTSGLEWGNIDIFSGSKGESLNILHAYTYNIDNGNIIKIKVKKENIFETRVNEYILKTSVAFPDIKAGSIVEIEYTLSSNGISFGFEWQFEKKIPVDYSEINVLTRNGFEYNTFMKGFLNPNVTNNSYEKKYTLRNISAFKSEPFVNNIENYLTSVKFELSQVNIPGRMTENLSNNWESVVENINKFTKFGNELNKTGYFEEELNKLLEGKLIRADIIDVIFNFVKNNVKWNEKYGYTCIDGVKEAFKNKNGNVAEINLMLTAMLRFAGLDANPILISTQSNGFVINPSLTAFNYVICGVEIENDIILLDATEKFALPNILPKRALNWFGRIIRKSGSSAIVELMPKKMSSKNYNLMVDLMIDGSIKGKLRNTLNNHQALFQRIELKNDDNDKIIEKFENEFEGINISENTVENLNETEKPLILNYTFEKNNHIEIVNDKIFFSPMFFLKTKENPFKAEKREYPVDFTFPTESNYNIIITIPDGYAVESYPEQIKIAFEDMATFTYLLNVSGNRIILKVSEVQKTPIVSSEYYETLKEYYQKMVDKQNEKIVLKKI